MATEKKDSITQGKATRLLVGQNGPYGVELDNGIVLRKSQFGTIVDLTGIKEGDHVQAAYYESKGKAYAKEIKVVPAPGSGQAAGQDDVFVPEPEAGATLGTSNGNTPGEKQDAMEKTKRGPQVSVSTDSPGPVENEGGQNGGQKKTWAEQQADKDQYWTNKANIDMVRLTLDREKFEFEKKRADNIAKQAAIKGATEIVLAVYNMEAVPGIGVADLISKIYKTAFYLNRPLDVDFPQALKELNKKLEPDGPAAQQFDGIRQAAGVAPGVAPGA